MLMKTTLAAAAVATAIAAQPITTAEAAPPPINFSFGIQTPNGYFQFGNAPGFYPQPQAMTCWEARQYLKANFKKVVKVECNGQVYTFKVKKFNFGPYKTAKINRNTGQYWIV